MRFIGKALLLVALTVLTAGPAFAAALPVSHGLGVSAPSHGPASPLANLIGWLAGGAVAFGITIKRDIGTIAQKFVTRAQAAAPDYKTGVQNAGGKWEQNTVAAEQAYEQGVQASITNKRFQKGVGGKGSKYQTNAVALGAQRYGPGVQNAQQAYQAGMAPVLAALSGIQLPAKSFRGSPNNMQRSNMVASTLAALRASK